MTQEFSAGSIIFRNEEGKRLYLLLHYQSGHWSFAKGHIEAGEEAQETVKREVWEETGIKNIRFVSGFLEKTEFRYSRQGELYNKEVQFFLSETDEKDVSINSPKEHQGFEWLPYEEAYERLTFENDKRIIKKAEELLRSTHS